MSTELAATLAHATDAAGQMGFPEVNLEHLLAALCDDPEALAILDSSGVEAVRVRADAVSFLSRSAGPPVTDRSSLFLSEEVRRILDAATAAARGGRRRDINGAILLAAIVGDGRSLAAQMLQSHGLSFESAIKALQASLGQPPRERSLERPMLADEVLARARERVQTRAAPSLQQIMADMPRPTPPPPMPFPDVLASPSSFDPLPEPVPLAEETVIKPSELLETLKEANVEPAPQTPADPMAALVDADAAPTPAPSSDDDHSMPVTESEPPGSEAPRVADVASPEMQPVAGAAAEAEVIVTAPQNVVAESYEPKSEQKAPESPFAPASKPATIPDRLITAMGAPPPGPAPQRQPFPPLGLERPRPGPDLPPPIPPNALPPGMPPLSARAVAAGPASHPSTPHPGAPIQPAPPPGLNGPLAAGPRLPPQGAPPGSRPPYGPHAPLGPQPLQGSGPQPQTPQPQMPPPRKPVGGSVPAARERGAKGDGSPLLENIPRAMRAGVTERVEIRIARAAMMALGSGLEGPQAGRRYGVGAVQAVTVRLRAPEGGFFIETASPEAQWIDGQHGISIDEFASWRFNITPQSKGRAPLQIMTSARIVGSDGILVETPMPDHVVEVKVRRNSKRSLASCFGWLVAAAVGAALALAYERGFETVRPLVERLTN